MKNLSASISSFGERTRLLSDFVKNPKQANAAFFIVRSKFDRSHRGKGFFHGMPFFFRAKDVSGVREVLRDKEYSFLDSYLASKTNPVIADIGAHIGTFSLYCFSKNPGTRILSVEASPSTYALLNDTVSQQNQKTWTVIHRAAWKDGESVSFSDAGDAMSHKVDANGTLRVEGISLSSILEKTGAIDIAKIDIEGAEEVFLFNTPEALDRISTLVIELHPDRINEKAVRDLLNSKFTQVKDIQGRISSKPLLLCTR